MSQFSMVSTLCVVVLLLMILLNLVGWHLWLKVPKDQILFLRQSLESEKMRSKDLLNRLMSQDLGAYSTLVALQNSSMTFDQETVVPQVPEFEIPAGYEQVDDDQELRDILQDMSPRDN